jgi:hypothetical protein
MVASKRSVLKAIIALKLLRRSKAKKRSFYARPLFLGRANGAHEVLLAELEQDPLYYKKYLRFVI